MFFIDLLDELKGTTSKHDKEEILSYYMTDEETGNFHKFLLREAFDPNLLHHVVLRKNSLPSPGLWHLEECVTEVMKLFADINAELSSAKNRAEVLEVMEGLTEADQLALFGIVNKKLRCGVSLRTVNKVHPDLIPVIPIGLANTYKLGNEHKYSAKLYCSHKLDGQRVFCVRSNNEWKKYSRAGDYLGNEITTLDHWNDELDHYYEQSGTNFLDGEAYRHGMIFEEITGLVKSSVNKKDATPLQYHIFFAGRTFDLKKDSQRSSVAGIDPRLLETVFKSYKYLVGVPQGIILNHEEAVYEQVDKAIEAGYEGVMLRSYISWYTCKRSDDLLKVKKSNLSGTIEYTDAYVEDMEYGDYVVREDGVEAIERLPVALWVSLPQDPSTQLMKVGSGFTLAQRRAWTVDEGLILCQTAELEHQGFGAKGRMRFPRFLRVRSDL